MSAIQWLTSDSPASRRQAAAGQVWRTLASLLANPLALAGLAVIVTLVFLAAFGPWLAPQDPYAQDLARRLMPPSSEHWFGTDALGRDILSRIVTGARISLAIVLLVAAIAGPLGLLVGILAGYAGGTLDTLLMRVTDIFMAFPRLLLALAVAAALSPGLENAVIAIAVTSWPPYARLARSEALVVRHADFIAAVRLKGASLGRILLGHIAPLCLSSLLVRLTLDMAGNLLIAAGLGFLGLGAQPPSPEWGAMVAAGRDFITDQWWVAAIPGAAIFVVSLGFNLLGDGLRDVLDPKLR
jgi:peptide/nickel transport system permease protein